MMASEHKYEEHSEPDGCSDQSSSSSSIEDIEVAFAPPIKNMGEILGEHLDEETRAVEMVRDLMARHSEYVSSSLVERSNTIQSIKWLSRHVPGCVLRSLFKSILRGRKEKAREMRRMRRTLGRSEPITRAEKLLQGGVVVGKGTKGGEDGIISSDDMAISSEDNMTSTDEMFSSSFIKDGTIPIAKNHANSALLFVDISGFTKISVLLDVESLSSAINSYFQMIVNEISTFGGDILKFAGDAIFVEWKASSSSSSSRGGGGGGGKEVHRSLEYCVSLAANCAASIVANCSGYIVSASKPIGTKRSCRISRRRSSNFTAGSSFTTSTSGSVGEEGYGVGWEQEGTSRVVSDSGGARLDVKCGVGVGRIVGIHVGDDISRREYLILGDPIDQVAKAESAASHGEAFASPEAVEVLAKAGQVTAGGWEDAVKERQPILIADHTERYFDTKYKQRESNQDDIGDLLNSCDLLDSSELYWLKRMLSLYVHPVVVNDENQREITMRNSCDYERHLAEAELRNVYTCFITPLIDHRLTGDEGKDRQLFLLLNNILNLTMRELDRVQGHLRQFILDDKGLILICTFGLRGSTFPNMIAERAVPFTLSVHKALEEELGVKSRIGATFGKAYCGSVGGLERHEFAVLGPAVNLAARLMSNKDNPGILVDKNVRLLTTKIFFKPLPAVNAKGYNEPVPIFEPLQNKDDTHWGRLKKDFIGRVNETKAIMRLAKDVEFHGTASKMLFISAVEGSGKSTLMVQATEHVRAMMKKMDKRLIVTRNISNDGDSRLPFSLFRSIFKDILSQIRHEDMESQASSSREGSNSSMQRRRTESFSSVASECFSIDKDWDSLSLNTRSSTSSTRSTDVSRFRFLCNELNAPPEFVEVIGKRLLGLRERSTLQTQAATNSKALDLEVIVDFMSDAFIRCTKSSELVLLALDDVQWMDEMSWKVVQKIFEHASNVFILCGSRPPSASSLKVDPIFWSNLQGQFREDGRYTELSLGPFSESEVQEMVATNLQLSLDEIDTSFSRNVFTTTGGAPHYLSFVLDAIKRNNLTVELENGLIGLSSTYGDDKSNFGSISELLLHRLDALDASVRTVLHLSAVLGTEFDLLDAALAYDEMFEVEDSKRMETALVLRSSFTVAVEEGILEQSQIFIEEDDDDENIDPEEQLCLPMESVTISGEGHKSSHPLYNDNCRLRFTHDSWKASILSVLLEERKKEMHEHIAVSLEREMNNESQDDFQKQIRVFKHFKSSGNFVKAATIAIDVGGQLMLLGLNSQAVLLFDDTVDILRDSADNDRDVSYHGGISSSILDALSASELEQLIKLHVSKGKAHSTLVEKLKSAKAYQSALDILNSTPSASDEGFDRSVTFPIFSGLFFGLKSGAISQDEGCSYEKDLCKEFVEQARLNGDPIHYGRALGMQGETLARLGCFEQALEVVDRIKAIYNIETQHTDICKAYGSDRVAQTYSHSVNWNNALGRTQAALDTCIYIVEELVPKSDPKNVHNTFCLLFSVLVALKENGMALNARDTFQSRVIDPFEEHFGQGGSTPSKVLMKPILILLDLQGHENEDYVENIDDYMSWALEKSNLELRPVMEVAFGAFAVNPKCLFGEILFCLARRKESGENRGVFIQRAIEVTEQSISTTANLPYPTMYAKAKLEMMKKYEKEKMAVSDDLPPITTDALPTERQSLIASQPWDRVSARYPIGQEGEQPDTETLVDFASTILEMRLADVVKHRRLVNEPSDSCVMLPSGEQHVPLNDIDVGESTVLLTSNCRYQLRSYIRRIASMYRANRYHGLEHGCHVLMSANKLLDMLTSSESDDVEDVDFSSSDPHLLQNIHNDFNDRHIHKRHGRKSSTHLYIYSDMLSRFAFVFAAFIHDVDHQGVPNARLVAENDPIVEIHGSTSTAEKHSINIAFRTLNESEFDEFRMTVFDGPDDQLLMHRIVTNSVLSTDIASKDRMTTTKVRWEEAFSRPLSQSPLLSGRLSLAVTSPSSEIATVQAAVVHVQNDYSFSLQHPIRGDQPRRNSMQRSQSSVQLGQLVDSLHARAGNRADNDGDDNDDAMAALQHSVIIETMLNVADVAHSMQSWELFLFWNQKLFEELYVAFKGGQSDNDPSNGWYENQLGFYRMYVIPLAKKMNTCGVFGKLGSEWVKNAVSIRDQWTREGEQITEDMIASVKRDII